MAIQKEEVEIAPLVSIIIPAFNAEKWIGKCIDSCLLQSYQNIEVLVVNDGSTDNTSLFLQEKYKNKIKIFNIDNQGASKARVLGLEKSIGDLIFFLDSDDELIQFSIENLVINQVSNNYDLVIGQARIILINNKILPTKYFTSHNHFQDFLKGHLPVTLWPSLYTRKILNSIELRSVLTIGEDYIIACQIYSKHSNLKVLDDEVYIYYKHDESITASMDNKKFTDNYQAFLIGLNYLTTSYLSKNNEEEIFLHCINYLMSLIRIGSPYVTDCIDVINSLERTATNSLLEKLPYSPKCLLIKISLKNKRLTRFTSDTLRFIRKKILNLSRYRRKI